MAEGVYRQMIKIHGSDYSCSLQEVPQANECFSVLNVLSDMQKS